MRQLVIGGVRSGKSDFAEKQLAKHYHMDKQTSVYIATSLAVGDETKHRIAQHQLQRDKSITTCELDYKTLTLKHFITQHDNAEACILIECLSTWVGWYLSQDKPLAECIIDYEKCKNDFLAQIKTLQASVIIVTGEVGCGLIGDTKLMRTYADKLGELNQQVASLADNVTLVTAGIAQVIKS